MGILNKQTRKYEGKSKSLKDLITAMRAEARLFLKEKNEKKKNLPDVNIKS